MKSVGGYQVGIVKDSIVRNGSLRVALAELQEEAVPSVYLDVLREVDEGINELKSRWAKVRKSSARLSKTVSLQVAMFSIAD